jgi:thermitase
MKPSRFGFWWLASGIALAALLLVLLAGNRDWWNPDRPSPHAQPVTVTAPPVHHVAHLPPDPARAQMPRAVPTAPSSEERQWQQLRSRLERNHAIPHEAVIRFPSAAALNDFLRRARGWKIAVMGRLDAVSAVRVGFKDLDSLRDVIGTGVAMVENLDANYEVRVPDFLQEEDRPGGVGSASFGGLGFLEAIGAGGDRSTWGVGVTVAVVDSGVDNHPTFGENQVTHYDLVNDGQPFNSHGTAMASLIAGQDPQAPGVAPGSHILDVRVADSTGTSDSFTLAAGIVQAVDAGAHVINISLGSYGDSQAVRDAVNYAESRGAMVVAAAGNDETVNQLAFPAAISSVISVGGVDAKLQQAYYSNSGAGLDISAPGVGIQSAYGTGQLAIGDGTSQAAAITSGVLAYGLSSGATTAPNGLNWLKEDALPLSQPPDRVGAGMVQTKAK